MHSWTTGAVINIFTAPPVLYIENVNIQIILGSTESWTGVLIYKYISKNAHTYIHMYMYDNKLKVPISICIVRW